jgi:polynucleotide 5'-hydroxyl-kinase GRC3/NOL9
LVFEGGGPGNSDAGTKQQQRYPLDMTKPYQVNRDWERIGQRVVQPKGIVLVIGGTDVGKSTFCRFLVEQGVAKGLKVGFVDADVGQSQIGPPTTIGLKLFPQASTSNPDDLYFVGSTSPECHLLQCVTGTYLMIDAALEAGAELVVIDTTGYVEGDAAVALKRHKIELIQPDYLICIHRFRELNPIVAGFIGLSAIQIHHLSPHKSVASKSSESRRKYRKTRFESYFSDAVQESVPFDRIRGQRSLFFVGRQANTKEREILSNFVDDDILYAEWGHKSLSLVAPNMLSNPTQGRLKSHYSLTSLVTKTPAHFEQRLIGMLNDSMKTLSIGVIESVDFRSTVLRIRCKPNAASDAKIIQFGQYKDEGEDRRIEVGK